MLAGDVSSCSIWFLWLNKEAGFSFLILHDRSFSD